jgi:mono/diheme cytochrome c family protein
MRIRALLRPLTALAVVSAAAMAAGGCAIKHPVADLVAGKQLFVAKCGVCHTLSHAATSGTVGPNLDVAFHQDRADGIKSTSIEGLVDYWIQYPDSEGAMPANCARKPTQYAPSNRFCLTSQQVQDVAAYVGAVAARSGQDTGNLASAVQQAVAVTPAAGKNVFMNVGGCGGCHILTAAGTTGTTGPNLSQRLASDCALPASQRIRGKTLAECIHTAIVNPYAFLPSGYPSGVMPNTFSKTLSKTQIAALVAFLTSVTK